LSLTDELIRYSNNILSGKITGCKKKKWACQRFLNDIAKQRTTEFPYVFSEQKAERFTDFCRLFKHTKGVIEGQFIELQINQRFDYGNIFGWIHKDTGLRRFRKSYKQVGRKNAKSQEEALVGLYETFADGESAAEVYCAATKTKQAKIVWNEAKMMLTRCEALKGKYTIAYGRITHTKSGSFMEALSKEDGKTGDGTHVQCGIVDEYHLHPTSEMLDMLTSGKNARRQPLIMIITTAGFDISNPCYRVEYAYVSQILDPSSPINNDQYYVMIEELDKGDDIKDESNWVKANPILCSYREGIEGIREDLQEAIDAPEKMRNFLTKNMNVWVDQKENGYMAMDRWAKCGVSEDNPWPDVTGLSAISGLDLSAVLDLTSVSSEIDLPDGRKAVMSHSFIPEDTLAVKTRSDNVPYALWVEQGWITATPGASVDYNYILQYMDNEYEKNKWFKGEVCYDRYLATWLRYQLELREYIPVDIPQGIPTLGEPTKDFRVKVYEGNVIHQNNPVLTWAINNAVTRPDQNNNIMLDKGKSKERIDPIAALINCHVRGISSEPVIDLETHILSAEFSF